MHKCIFISWYLLGLVASTCKYPDFRKDVQPPRSKYQLWGTMEGRDGDKKPSPDCGHKWLVNVGNIHPDFVALALGLPHPFSGLKHVQDTFLIHSPCIRQRIPSPAALFFKFIAAFRRSKSRPKAENSATEPRSNGDQKPICTEVARDWRGRPKKLVVSGLYWLARNATMRVGGNNKKHV